MRNIASRLSMETMSSTVLTGLRNFLRLRNYPIILVLALAVFLRLYELGSNPPAMFWDEILATYTPYLYQQGFYDFMTQYLMPPLSVRGIIPYVLSGTYFTYSLFGFNMFFTRLPEAILGVLLVFVVYLLAKEMFSKRVALISAALVAICPWALHFSRFQAFCSAYVLYFTVSILFLCKGINADSKRRQFVWFCLGSLVLGLTADTHMMARVFVPLFIIGFLVANLRMRGLKISSFLPKGIVYITIFLLAVSPVFLEYLTQVPIIQDGLAMYVNYSTYSHSQNIFDLSRMVLERAGMHLSPGFLVFTAPATHDLYFEETISRTALLRYSPTIFGELNFYGILVYPGMLLLLYEAVKRKSKEHMTVLWWIICYSVVSGVAYYDNPQSTRTIVGLPALIITIALFIEFLLKATHNRQGKSTYRFVSPFKPLLTVLLVCLVTVPTGLFLHEYYVNYPAESARVFDYGYREVADYLSTNGLWVGNISVHDKYGRNVNLAFYSPEQPPPSEIITIYGDKDFDRISKNSLSILVTRYQEDSAILSEYGISCKLLKSIYYPDGTLAFSIYGLQTGDWQLGN